MLVIGGEMSVTGDYLTLPVKMGIKKFSLNIMNAVSYTHLDVYKRQMQLHESLIHQITTVLSPCMRLLDTRIQILYQIRAGTALHRFIPVSYTHL